MSRARTSLAVFSLEAGACHVTELQPIRYWKKPTLRHLGALFAEKRRKTFSPFTSWDSGMLQQPWYDCKVADVRTKANILEKVESSLSSWDKPLTALTSWLWSK
jgi:hypothetical protein